MRRITVHTQAFPAVDLDPTCELVVVEGPDEGARVDVGALPIRVGTEDGHCHLVLIDDRVSRRHLEVCVVDGFFEVRDLDSRNGTIYRGSVLKQARLRPSPRAS